MPILAKDLGKILWNMLEEAVETTMPEASQEEKEECKANILVALGACR